jgi:hypothetical protein
MNESWRTAIFRDRLAVPTQYLFDNTLLHSRILDYGCGKCHDINNEYFKCDGYDPHLCLPNL